MALISLTPKAARSFVGLNPSHWSSGQMESPSREISKEGPPVLRLAFYQAAHVARTHDPQLADLYRRLMVERGHCHTKAKCAVARKLVARTWATITSGASYELRDLNGTPVTRREATKLAAALAVPDDIRCRATRHAAPASPTRPLPASGHDRRLPRRSQGLGHHRLRADRAALRHACAFARRPARLDRAIALRYTASPRAALHALDTLDRHHLYHPAPNSSGRSASPTMHR
jgi:hypothetical protein